LIALPDFPWDQLVPAADLARTHVDGIVDLSVGTPVDPTPQVIQEALRAAADSPGYPFTAGTAELSGAVLGYLHRRCGASPAGMGVIPTIGTKEFVAWLPTLLGLGSGSTVAIPRTAYPTYRVGALIARARVVEADTIAEYEDAAPDLIWLNSPSNPTGEILDAAHLAEIVSWARHRQIPVVSDECYFELAWTARSVSLLDEQVCGGSTEGILALHSLSKRSNLAGYRFGFAAGDPQLVASILQVRKHAGMIVPMPIQLAAIAALGDDSHVEIQREVYLARRNRLAPALEGWGLRIDHSEGGLYLWATAGEPCWTTVGRLAELGILVAPGDFYGQAGEHHVRVALTATDERIEAAVNRLTAVNLG